ncbi:hypothetical protein M0812_04518 [Anaeramoeba flamelloides]|uniref:Calcineurin-like phosphoesterase domain-containing protein n=1 Tax=Anaeramoeba flamelloides TaxID=1746091 RepID=A0AAV8AFR2_9EUKA|nr:hypothetical protein M0812_04518 [Anaeramoeba flamelloides]
MKTSPFGFISFFTGVLLLYFNKCFQTHLRRKKLTIVYLRNLLFSPLVYNILFERSLSHWDNKKHFFDLRTPGDQPTILHHFVHIYFLLDTILPLLRITLALLYLDRGIVFQVCGVLTQIVTSTQLLSLPGIFAWYSFVLFFSNKLPFWIPFLFFSYILFFQLLSIIPLIRIPYRHIKLEFNPFHNYGKKSIKYNRKAKRKLKRREILEIEKNNEDEQKHKNKNKDLEKEQIKTIIDMDEKKQEHQKEKEKEKEKVKEKEKEKGNENKKDKEKEKGKEKYKEQTKQKKKTQIQIEEYDSDFCQSENETLQMLDNEEQIDEGKNQKCLKIIQITDLHLGIFTSVKWIQNYCKKLIKRNPDLIVITGDLLTEDTENEKGIGQLRKALQPLKKFPKGRIYACLGNHDVSVRESFILLMKEIGIILLIDQECVCKLGKMQIPVQILGCDWYQRDPKPVQRLVNRFPPREDVQLRIILSHATDNWKFLPNDDRSITFSGHTHGGVLGLTFLGLPYSILSPLLPDQGIFACGNKMLYVNRGTGYGSMIRLGIPPEDSMMYLHFNPLKLSTEYHLNNSSNSEQEKEL